MAEGSFRNDIKQLSKLDDFAFENIFKVYQEEGNYYFYNILKTINFDGVLSSDIYYDYTIKGEIPYTALSYEIYEDIKLWWLIVVVNGINNPVEFPKRGTVLKIIKPAYVREVLNIINQQLKNGR